MDISHAAFSVFFDLQGESSTALERSLQHVAASLTNVDFGEIERRTIEEQKMLSFTVYKLGDTTLFRCTGRLVSGDSEYLQDAVLTRSHARSIVLDMTEIRSVDAAGLGMLLSLRARTKTTGTSFKLMNLTPRVEEVFELTNLRDVFEFCSVPEMLALMCLAVGQTRAVAAVQVEMPQPLTGRPAASNCANVSDPAA